MSQMFLGPDVVLLQLKSRSWRSNLSVVTSMRLSASYMYFQLGIIHSLHVMLEASWD